MKMHLPKQRQRRVWRHARHLLSSEEHHHHYSAVPGDQSTWHSTRKGFLFSSAFAHKFTSSTKKSFHSKYSTSHKSNTNPLQCLYVNVREKILNTCFPFLGQTEPIVIVCSNTEQVELNSYLLAPITTLTTTVFWNYKYRMHSPGPV